MIRIFAVSFVWHPNEAPHPLLAIVRAADAQSAVYVAMDQAFNFSTLAIVVRRANVNPTPDSKGWDVTGPGQTAYATTMEIK